MIPVRLSRDAANYVRKEAEYLRHHSPAAARKFSQAVKEARELLRTFPEVGNHMHGLLISGNRTLVVGDYLLDYSYDGEAIEVTSIRHGRTVAQTPDLDLDAGLDDDAE
ncbi:type II toxin-antitoxin system RelE/ParE family toxin [Rhizobium sp. 16-449-1b]|uniref:type II toxin-antitoxin system RelE/ParE family toxin n=1 Tax=Rhizobium sp. 16-449-1b TaxID=2819989 RepID=UPI001ADCF86E|nr:type II toxin-antitoxin system RelE/ParE family toxin [Rhizobium sp. 16-449-1b]MBO9194408.1 type II toxin-antitoxin system RelE/ParE family toxin [Rhizobium sp. 16-449-1b]